MITIIVEALMFTNQVGLSNISRFSFLNSANDTVIWASLSLWYNLYANSSSIEELPIVNTVGTGAEQVRLHA